jgi:hypothetical protein
MNSSARFGALRSTPGPARAAILTPALAAAIGGRWLQSLLRHVADRSARARIGGSDADRALVATLLPARATSRANPTSLLRSE